MRLLLIALLLSIPAMSLGAWQDELEAQFDIAESFDELDDWLPSYSRGTVTDQSRMPVKTADGSPSIWNAYSYWPTDQTTDYWIKNHGAANVWGGTGKSMILDMDQDDSTSNLGPGRLKTYFGSNTADQISPYTNSGIVESGYRDDVYIFTMVKIPATNFSKTEEDYDYFSFFKFQVLATGKTNVSDCTEGRSDCEYGASNIHTMLTTGATYDDKLRLKLEYYSDAYTDGDGSGVWDALNLPDQGSSWFQKYVPAASNTAADVLQTSTENGEWFGLETHVHRGTPGATNGYQEYWLYDDVGSIHYVGRVPSDYMMVPTERDWGFNYFFQGGNISFQSTVDSEGLTTTYYVDDIVIDNDRIGPTYFSMLAGDGTCSTTALYNCDQTECEALTPTHYYYDNACHADQQATVSSGNKVLSGYIFSGHPVYWSE